MNSRQCRALLLDYLEGELSAPQCAAVEAALARYPECQLELDALRTTRSLVAAAPLPGDGPTEPYWDAFETRVLAHTREATPRRSFAPWLAPLGLAVATAAIVFAVNAMTPTVTPPEESQATYVALFDGTANADVFASDGVMEWADPEELAVALDTDALDSAPLLFADSGSWATDASADDFLGETDWYTELEYMDASGLDALLERLDTAAS